jgi:hypothetical protein
MPKKSDSQPAPDGILRGKEAIRECAELLNANNDLPRLLGEIADNEWDVHAYVEQNLPMSYEEFNRLDIRLAHAHVKVNRRIQRDGTPIASTKPLEAAEQPTIRKLVKDALERKNPSWKMESHARAIGVDKTVLYDVQNGKKVSKGSYEKISAYIGVPIDQLTPTNS